jgi:HAD superfamily, subfamily IIIB (Acid phosphatase)
MRAVLLFLAGALSATIVAVAIGAAVGTDNIRETSRSDGTPIIGLRPTGVGLPLVGAEGTVGAGDYAADLRAYHDSGAYQRDLAAVGRQALRYVVRSSTRIRRGAARRCARARREGVRGAALQRACRRPRLGVVFDVDETSVSSYEFIAPTDFKEVVVGLALGVIEANRPAIEPTLDIFRYARGYGIRTFFVTGRPGSVPGARDQTELNLERAGYSGYTALFLHPELGGATVPYKSGVRAEIERGGVRIIANIGDQESDLEGGHADRAFKYPNPFYFIGAE